jgi:hypothetical protein
VLFSRKSVVRCTPPIEAPPVNPDASPPPLGFWTKITAPKKKQMIKIITVRRVPMIVFLVVA